MLLTLLSQQGAQPQPPAPVVDGPWRLLSGDYPQPFARDRAKVFWPGDADFPPARSPVPGALPLVADAPLVIVTGESPFRAELLGELARTAVRRGTDPTIEAAIAILLLA